MVPCFFAIMTLLVLGSDSGALSFMDLTRADVKSADHGVSSNQPLAFRRGWCKNFDILSGILSIFQGVEITKVCASQNYASAVGSRRQ